MPYFSGPSYLLHTPLLNGYQIQLWNSNHDKLIYYYRVYCRQSGFDRHDSHSLLVSPNVLSIMYSNKLF